MLVLLLLSLLELLESLLELLLVLLMIGVRDTETKAGATGGRVFAMPGTKASTKLAGRMIKHVYPADSRLSPGSDSLFSSPLSA